MRGSQLVDRIQNTGQFVDSVESKLDQVGGVVRLKKMRTEILKVLTKPLLVLLHSEDVETRGLEGSLLLL